MSFDPYYFVVTLFAVVISITIHEFAHAAAAVAAGDETPRLSGRISLNPLDHFDPVGFTMIVIMVFAGFGIGWGKPVPVNPYNFRDLRRDMMLTSIDHPGPAAIRYPRGNGFGVDISAAPKKMEIGKGEILRDGDDVAIIAYGAMVYPAVEAANNLAKDGIDATVINARFVKPLDDLLFALHGSYSQIEIAVRGRDLGVKRFPRRSPPSVRDSSR